MLLRDGKIIQGTLKANPIPVPPKASSLFQKMRLLKEEQDQYLQKIKLMRERVKVIEKEIQSVQYRIELAAQNIDKLK